MVEERSSESQSVRPAVLKKALSQWAVSKAPVGVAGVSRGRSSQEDVAAARWEKLRPLPAPGSGLSAEAIWVSVREAERSASAA